MKHALIHDSDSRLTQDGLCARLEILFVVSADGMPQIESIFDSDNGGWVELASLPESEQHKIASRIHRAALDLTRSELESDLENDL